MHSLLIYAQTTVFTHNQHVCTQAPSTEAILVYKIFFYSLLDTKKPEVKGHVQH